MTSFTIAQDFPVDLDRLWHAIGREAYVREKYRALGDLAVRLRRFAVAPGRIEVELERDLAHAVRLPPGLGADGPLLRTMWHRSCWRRDGEDRVDAELEIAPVGLPLRATGEGGVRADGPHRCRMVLHWQVHAEDVPVLARGLASAVFARRVREALDRDHAFTLRWLSGDVADRPGDGLR